MTTVNATRNVIQKRIFNTLGLPVTFISKSSLSYNTRGEIEGYTPITSSGVIVPYNVVTQQDYQPFGNIKAGELDAIIKYDHTVEVDDMVTFSGTTYLIKQIDNAYLGGVVAKIIRIVKEQA